ncbi:MAG: S41 family peptidase [Bacteroidales bacterium]
MNRNNILKKVLICIILILVGGIITRLIDAHYNNNLKVNSYRWDKINLVLSQIDQNYVDQVDEKVFSEKVLPGIMFKLDPHSVYLSPKSLKKAEGDLAADFDGIGISFNVPQDTAIVINVISDGPSDRSGLKSGDRIIKVGDKKVAGNKMAQDSLVSLMRGKAGTKVNLEIQRDHQLVDFTITRGKIPLNSIDVSYMINDTTGYIKLSKFSKTTYEEFVKHVDKLKAKGMHKLIFDLRDNSGGYFTQAILLSNEFLAKDDLIVYIKGAHRDRSDAFADGKGKCQDLALSLLINEDSASSSEIFAGAMQDNDRAVIYGRRSFGKGLVQEPIYFSDGSGIRLTVARFYMPSGRCIQKPYVTRDGESYYFDIYERYKHGEMSSADSIQKPDSLAFLTAGGRTVYGGGGIIPDVFVGIDTIGVTPLLVLINKKALQIKYASRLSDKYRKSLQNVKNFKELNLLLDSMNLETVFKSYVRENSIKINNKQWNISKKIMLTQLRALVGRYSSLDNDAFYPLISPNDNVLNVAINDELADIVITAL